MTFSSIFMSLIVAVGTFLGCLAVGLLIIAGAQAMLALREIALNTRKEARKGEYRVLLTVAEINNWLGWIIIIGGIAVALFMVLSGIKS